MTIQKGREDIDNLKKVIYYRWLKYHFVEVMASFTE